LNKRIKDIQETGLSTYTDKLFQMATAKAPQQVMADFFRKGSPSVVEAMQEAITSLFGALPPFQFESSLTTTGDKLVKLMLSLQMTGYMLRNTEYIMKIRELLKLTSRDPEDFKEAFDRLDKDESGFIDTTEAKQIFAEVYDGGDVPVVEVAALMQLFDTNKDGKISWEEFCGVLGAVSDQLDTTEGRRGLSALPSPSPADEPASPQVSGTVTVELYDGSEIEMDVNDYMNQLKKEARALRDDLSRIESQREEQKKVQEKTIASSVNAFMQSSPEKSLALLSESTSSEVRDVMRRLVDVILTEPLGVKEDPYAETTIEQGAMQQLCLYMLIQGYNLREMEARGDAEAAIGR